MTPGLILFVDDAEELDDALSRIAAEMPVAVFARSQFRPPPRVCFFRVRDRVDRASMRAAARAKFPGIDWTWMEGQPSPLTGLNVDREGFAAAPARRTGKDPCEVLSVLSEGDDQWTDYRGRRLGVWLRARGIAHGWTAIGTASELAAEARARGVRVILSEALVMPCEVAAELAAALPDVQIVHLLHGAPAWCASYAPHLTYGAIRQSRERANVYVGTVSDPSRMCWEPGAKVVHLPNPIDLPPELRDVCPPVPPQQGAELCVSLIARPFAAKNWGGMLAALGILAARRLLRVVCAGRNTVLQRPHWDYLAALGITAETMTFSDWSLTLHRVASQVHVGLACGFTDSLNLIAAEHCLMGIPVVGSPSTDWMPRRWRINPQDPEAMADLIEDHARHHTREGERGRGIVRAMARVNEILLVRNLEDLLG